MKTQNAKAAIKLSRAWLLKACLGSKGEAEKDWIWQSKILRQDQLFDNTCESSKRKASCLFLTN